MYLDGNCGGSSETDFRICLAVQKAENTLPQSSVATLASSAACSGLRQGIKNSSVILDTSLSAFHAGACPARNDVDFYEFCDESNLTIIYETIVRER